VGTAQCPEGDAECWFKDLEHEQIARLASIAGIGPRQTKSNKSLRDLTRAELLKGIENFAESFNFSLADMRECASKVLLKSDTLETQQSLFKTCIANASARKQIPPGESKSLSKLPDGMGTITMKGETLLRNLALTGSGDAKTIYGNTDMNAKQISNAVVEYKKSEKKLLTATKEIEAMSTKSQFATIQLLQFIKRHLQSLLSNVERVVEESQFFKEGEEDEDEEKEEYEDGEGWNVRKMLNKAGKALKRGVKIGVKGIWTGVKFVWNLSAAALAMFASSPLAMSVLTHPGTWFMVLKSVNLMKSILCHKLMLYLGVYKEVKPKTFYEYATDLPGAAYGLITEAAPFAILNIIGNGNWKDIWDVSGKFAFTGLKLGANFLPFGGAAASVILDGLEKCTSAAVQCGTEMYCYFAQYNNLKNTLLDILDVKSCFAAPPGYE
jgi:hypothetical protein